MAPLTSSQLLVLSVPAIAVLLHYFWFKKKRIGAQSDPGDRETDRTESSVETGKKSSVPVDIGPKIANKDLKESSSAPQPAHKSEDTPNKTFSRSFSAPIPIVLRERRSSNSFRISDEELDRQIEKIKLSEKITNPFDKIKSKNSSDSLSPSLNLNGPKSISPSSRIISGSSLVNDNSRIPTSIPNQEIIKALFKEDILEEIDPEITVVPRQDSAGKILPDQSDLVPTSEKENQTEEAITVEENIECSPSQELAISVDKDDTVRVQDACENNNDKKIEEISFPEEMTSTTNTEISEDSIPANTEAVAKMCSSGKTKEETSPAPVKSDNTNVDPTAQNKVEEEKCLVEDRPSSEEGSCSIEDRHSWADERPSSAEPAACSNTGAIPKKNKKKKFRKLECDLKDLGKKLRETKTDKRTAATSNRRSGQKSRSDSGCEREDANAHSSGRQSANESPSEAMMAASSSLTSLNESVGSNDSGKGCSEVITPPPQTNTTVEEEEEENVPSFYEFLIHRSLVGKLIGKKGSFVNSVYTKTNAHLVVKDHPYNEEEKVCIVEGTKEAITKAMKMVKQRFPKEKLKQFLPEDCVPPSMSLENVIPLPGGLNVETYVSFIIAPNHLYIQQPTHLTYPNYIFMHSHMNTSYQNEDVPLVPTPVKENILCVALAYNCWTRAWVMSADQETQMAYVKCLDLGGYTSVPFSNLKQIRHDYVALPFQATECLLANVEPAEDDWSEEALTLIKTLTTNRIVYTHVVSYTDDNIPEVNCQVIIDAKPIWINCELVKRSFAKWANKRPQVETSPAEQ